MSWVIRSLRCNLKSNSDPAQVETKTKGAFDFAGEASIKNGRVKTYRQARPKVVSDQVHAV